MKNTINHQRPRTAIVLAAGYGKRMLPLTSTVPKPLVEVGGTPLIARALATLKAAGVLHVVVNVHHLGQQIIDYLATIKDMHITISDERAGLLDSGGGVIKALSHFNDNAPFFILNSDTFWQDEGPSNLDRLSAFYDSRRMDMVLLTVEPGQALGADRIDFIYDQKQRLYRANGQQAGVIYGGALITSPALFAKSVASAHSLNRYFDEAMALNRLYGQPLCGTWYTVGDMAMIDKVSQALKGQPI